MKVTSRDIFFFGWLALGLLHRFTGGQMESLIAVGVMTIIVLLPERKKSRPERMKELRELISIAQSMLASVEGENTNIRDFAKSAVANRRAR